MSEYEMKMLALYTSQFSFYHNVIVVFVALVIFLVILSIIDSLRK